MTIAGRREAGPETHYKLYVYGKYADPLFQKYKNAATFLAGDRPNVEAVVEGFYETQFEQQVKLIVSTYGDHFNQCKPTAPIIFAETDENILYFANEERFMQWAWKRFKYEDRTRLIFYKKLGMKARMQTRENSGRSYCAISVAIGDEPRETVHLELFDEQCPELVGNFIALLQKEQFNGHPVHRIKSGAWVQAGDLVDGSGLHSVAANGELLRDESFEFRHDRAGLLGMSNHGKDTNGSQFYITLRELPFLDGKSVIIGRVVSGMRAVWKINRVPTRNERPSQVVSLYAELEHTKLGTAHAQ
mmetsp:Transcript_127453/g.366593  ORF Transcript_127453/g.366593 Transcript_127453/m.366593 type:complete len:303 (+) Transcript_127453:115-1023(+)